MRNNRKIGVLVLASFVSLGCTAYPEPSVANEPVAEDSQRLARKLHLNKKAQALIDRFKKLPTPEFMNLDLEKEDRQNPGLGQNPFTRDSISESHFVDEKERVRREILGFEPSADRAGIGVRDRPTDLIDNPGSIIRNPAEMETKGLLTAELEETPWSDHYWPIYQGTLGARYGVDEYVDLGSDWLLYFKSILVAGKSLLDVWNSGVEERINLLSPAEKYDLLLGTKHMSRFRDYWGRQADWAGDDWPGGFLTPGQWTEGQSYYNRSEDNEVETWMGICHGWAPAAYLHGRPEKTVNVVAADGITKIKFYPSDIKALSSYVWAKARTGSRFVGGRCNDKDPKEDKETGRILDEKCWDNNPGTWHMSVVNQIGVNKKSFVLDATYDYEVWNQPVYSYSYTYFNPLTHERFDSFEEAVVDYKGEMKKSDIFKKFRNRNFKKLVGVVMEVEYVVETMPSQRTIDSADYDATKVVTYMYDLEIDRRGQISGGEWYTNNHPDFLWHIPDSVVSNGAHFTNYDHALSGSWSPTTEALPENWKNYGIEAAVRLRRPLTKVVEALIEESRKD